MRIIVLHALLFSQAICSGSESAQLQERFSHLLPPGWEVDTEGSKVVVSRKDAVGFYNPLGLPTHTEEYLDSITKERKVCFQFRLRKMPSEEDAEKIRRSIRRSTRQIAAMEALLVHYVSRSALIRRSTRTRNFRRPTRST